MLKITDLKCYYGRIQAVKGITLSVGPGEVVSLIGANGSGKSTVLQAVCGLLQRWEGTILFQGSSVKGLNPPEIVRRGISLVPEGRMIFAPLTVLDNLKLGAYSRSRKNPKSNFEEDLEKALTLFPVLRERINQPAGTLSGGEQQMLAVSRALMARPSMLLLDEPCMGLAPMMVNKILDTIALLKSRGMTILLVEQNARAALQIADRGYVLETGKMVYEGRAADLLADPAITNAYLGIAATPKMKPETAAASLGLTF